MFDANGVEQTTLELERDLCEQRMRDQGHDLGRWTQPLWGMWRLACCTCKHWAVVCDTTDKGIDSFGRAISNRCGTELT